jgi:hypothetical protein
MMIKASLVRAPCRPVNLSDMGTLTMLIAKGLRYFEKIFLVSDLW